MRVQRKGNKSTFIYDGRKGLAAEVQKAREELEKKTTDAQREHLRWAYEKAKREHETYERRLVDLKNFIYSAEAELKRQAGEEAENA